MNYIAKRSAFLVYINTILYNIHRNTKLCNVVANNSSSLFV